MRMRPVISRSVTMYLIVPLAVSAGCGIQRAAHSASINLEESECTANYAACMERCRAGDRLKCDIITLKTCEEDPAVLAWRRSAGLPEADPESKNDEMTRMCKDGIQRACTLVEKHGNEWTAAAKKHDAEKQEQAALDKTEATARAGLPEQMADLVRRAEKAAEAAQKCVGSQAECRERVEEVRAALGRVRTAQRDAKANLMRSETGKAVMIAVAAEGDVQYLEAAAKDAEARRATAEQAAKDFAAEKAAIKDLSDACLEDIKKCTGPCDAKAAPKECTAAALTYSAKLELKKFQTYAKKACDAGSKLGCGFITAAQDWAGACEDVKDCAAYCDAGYGGGCLNLAGFYFRGEGVPVNASKATELKRKSCTLGWGTGCTQAGIALTKGFGTPRNLPEAQKALARACELKDLVGCALYERFCLETKTCNAHLTTHVGQ